MIHPLILRQLARQSPRGAGRPASPRRTSRLRRSLDRPGRLRASDDPTVPARPLAARLTAYCLGRLSHHHALAGRYREASDLAQAGLEVVALHRTERWAPLAAAGLHVRAGAAAALDGRPEEAAAACRAALEALESGADLHVADRAMREIALALGPRVDAVITTRTNRAPATCDAPNCAGHRLRA